ncbi:6-cysteine protein, putative [Plasmodium ovale]|uniref:6-cysteine protein, putative n=1 Tax=Plasmodium ovale TaxID=36330 RepID=A0A1C3KTR4_PLAOA|nr:6-cysteine protein, putative [Plasmodium ovale]
MLLSKVNFCVLLFFINVINAWADVTFEKEVETNLTYSGEQIVYARKPFRGKIYAFISAKKKCRINVHVSKNGVNWEDKNDDINVEENNSNGTSIFSVITTADKIIVIFRCANSYYIVRIGDNLMWSIPEEIKFSDFPTEAVPAVYSGSLLFLNSEFEKFILICEKARKNGESDEGSDNVLYFAPFSEIQLLGRCKLSFDEGKIWKDGVTNLFGDESYNQVKEINLTENHGKLVAKVTYVANDEKEITSMVLLCNHLYKNDFFFDYFKLHIPNEYTLENYEIVNSYNLAILKGKNGGYLHPSFVYNLGETFEPVSMYEGKDEEHVRLTGTDFQFVAWSNIVVYLFYLEIDGKTKLVKINTPVRKAGCEITQEEGKNKEYTSTYSFKNIQGQKICKISSSEIETTEDGLYKLFYVKVPNNVSLKKECFLFSFNKELDKKFHTKIIKKRVSKKVSNEIEMELFFPLYYTTFLYNHKRTYCQLSNNYQIVVHFDYLRNVLDLNYTQENDSIAIYSGDNIVHAKRRHNKNSNFAFPKGTYITSFLPFEIEYIVSNFISKNMNTTITLPHGSPRKLEFISGGHKHFYYGVDLADASPNYADKPYKVTLESTTEEHDQLTNVGKVSKKVDVIVSNFSGDSKIIGLTCPVSTNLEGFQCFDNVYIKRGILVKIEDLFGSNNIFVIPKRKLFTPGGEEVLESLLHLNSHNMEELRKEKSIFHFYCECYIHNELVKVNYYISAYYNESFVKEEITKGEQSAIINKHIAGGEKRMG